MMDMRSAAGSDSPVGLEINISHRYKAGQMGVFEFRIRNQGSRVIQALELAVECPCEKSRRKSAVLKNIAPSTMKKPFFQFEPARGGEALLDIEISLEDQNRLIQVYRGQTSVSISAENEGSTSPTSFSINIHDINKLMGNDLSGLITMAGKEINEAGLREKMERKEIVWMGIDLDLDERESVRRLTDRRRIIHLPSGYPPSRTRSALLESGDPALPRRVFVYSAAELRFGRNSQKNDVVLRFLPDFSNDERSRTISGEQFVVRCSEGECHLNLAEAGRAIMSIDGRVVRPTEQVLLKSGSEIKIGSHEFALKVGCVPSGDNPHWARTRKEILDGDPGDDPFKATRWDLLSFTRRMNGPEEEYWLLLKKMDLAWEAGAAPGLKLGQVANPRARLSAWNGRYYLETLADDAGLVVGGRALQPGDVACLGADIDISFGPFPFHWRLT